MGLKFFDSDDEIAYFCLLISNSLSVIGCLFILIVFCLGKPLRGYAFQLVAYLALCDLLKSISRTIPTYSDSSKDVLCQFQSIFYQFFAMASFLLTLVMSLSLYLCVVKNIENIEKYHFISLTTVIIISGLFTFLGFYFKVYGVDNYWCWVKDKVWRMILFFGPLWTINLTNFFLYYKIIQHFECDDSSIYRLRAYPMILTVCYLPFTLLRILQFFEIELGFWLLITSIVGDGVAGVINSICYGFTDHVKKFLQFKLCPKRVFSAHELLDIDFYNN